MTHLLVVPLVLSLLIQFGELCHGHWLAATNSTSKELAKTEELTAHKMMADLQ